MEDYLKCVKCAEIEHEGSFCRCEERNIRIAKEQRSRGESAWKSKEKYKIDDIYELKELIEKLEKIREYKTGNLNYPKAFYTLAKEIEKIHYLLISKM